MSRHALLFWGVTVALVALAVVFRDRLGTDFWPLDRSTVGPNIVAAVICAVPSFGAGVVVGKRMWHHHRAHQEWQARHMAALYRKVTGREPDAHPHFDVSAAGATVLYYPADHFKKEE